MTDRIQELADSTSADRAGVLADNEVVSFRLRADGSTEVTLASGEVLTAMNSDAVPAAIGTEHRAVRDAMLVNMALLVPGNLVHAGVTYHRRRIATGDGQFSVIFLEAGR